MKHLIRTLLFCVAAHNTAFADIRVDRKATVTMDGPQGALMQRLPGGGGIETSVIIKGNRRMTTGLMTAQIVDLDEEKIYDLDLKRKKYAVTTFAEIRLRNQDVQDLYERSRPPDDPASDALALARAVEQTRRLRFEMVRKQTGRTRTINGFEAFEVISTTRFDAANVDAQTMTVVEWLVAEIANYGEIAEFDRRYGEKLGQPARREEMAGIQAQAGDTPNPLAELMMSNYRIEDDGTKGIPVLTVTVMGGGGQDGPEAETPQKQKKSKLGSFAGKLGRLSTGASGTAAGSGSRETVGQMTSQHEIVRVSTTISSDEVAVPQGFSLEKSRRR